ncbi:MAG: hypothetical protein QOI03_1793 [Solirubrobacteraceae bacterium]|jgi:hypothetical protein|nr:hypothetical protein [Solirubrobacteraceae bacterium]
MLVRDLRHVLGKPAAVAAFLRATRMRAASYYHGGSLSVSR